MKSLNKIILQAFISHYKKGITMFFIFLIGNYLGILNSQSKTKYSYVGML